MWFVEELRFGEWVPATYAEKPDRKRNSGRMRTFRADPVEVTPWMKRLTLQQICEVLSPDGKFNAQHKRETGE